MAPTTYLVECEISVNNEILYVALNGVEVTDDIVDQADLDVRNTKKTLSFYSSSSQGIRIAVKGEDYSNSNGVGCQWAGLYLSCHSDDPAWDGYAISEMYTLNSFN